MEVSWSHDIQRAASPTRSVLLSPAPTPSLRFAADTTAGLKARAWVEEVIGRRLPEGDFAAGFKDGVGLCELVNVFKPGAIAKIETSGSPFHQMANISCFLRAIRTLGVREQVMFETLDLFNENRLTQVVRCLFSLSELVRAKMPSFPGPFLAAPEKPQVDPAVLHIVDIAKGNVVPAPGWGGGGPMTPGAASTASSGGGVGCGGAQVLKLPDHARGEGCCLSPAAHEAGKLTYGIYEGGGVAAAKAAASELTPPQTSTSPRFAFARGAAAAGGGGTKGPENRVNRGAEAAAAAAAAIAAAARGLEAQLHAEEEEQGRVLRQGGGMTAAAAAEGAVPTVIEYAESALPVVNTPRAVLPTPRLAAPTPSRERMTRNWRMVSLSPPREEVWSGSAAAGKGGSGVGDSGSSSSSLEEQTRRTREAKAQRDAEMEVALWIEGVTGDTFPGKFWSSLKDGVILCKVIKSIKPGIIKPGLPHTSRGVFPELENLSAFLRGCREMGVAEHSLFDPRDLHEKRDMQAVVRCFQVLGAAVQTTVPEFRGPFLGKKSEALAVVNARGLRKRLGKGPGARGGIRTLAALKGAGESQHLLDSGEVPLIEHPDPTATITPAESPAAKEATHRRLLSDSAAGSGADSSAPPPLAAAAGAQLGAVVTPAIAALELEAGATRAVVRGDRKEGQWRSASRVEDAGGVRRHLAEFFAAAAAAATTVNGEQGEVGAGMRVSRRGIKAAIGGCGGTVGGGGRGGQRLVGARANGTGEEGEGEQVDDDQGEAVVSQVQRFVETHTRQRWRISGDLHESLRDGWQLALLANALRPGAIARVHNSIQPAKQVQNIANFLIACRRMGVARALLFNVEDLYEDKSRTRVSRTLLALRALAADPDFACAKRSALTGTSLLVAAAAVAKEAPPV